MIKWRAIFMVAKGSSEASVQLARLLGVSKYLPGL